MKTTRFFTLMFAAFAISAAGCVNLPRTLEPEPIFAAPGSSVPVPNVPLDSSGSICVMGGNLPDGSIPAEVTQFSVAMYCAYQRAPGDADYDKWMVRFVDKGLSLSDQTCERFFNALEARRVEASYAQTNMNIGGAAATAILAVTDTHRRAIFNLATALTAGNAWFENYKANYIMTPQTRKVHDLIQIDLRNPIRGQILAKSQANGYRSFDEAKQDIMKYDSLCSHKVIQDVVTEAVARAELHTFTQPVPGGKAEKADKEKRDIYKVASGGVPGGFIDNQFEALYAVATMSTDEERADAATALVDLYPDFANYVSKLGLDNAKVQPSTLTQFRYVGELLNLESSRIVAKFRKLIKERILERASVPQPPAGSNAAPLPPPQVTGVARQQILDALRSPQAQGSRAIDFRWEIRDHRRQE